MDRVRMASNAYPGLFSQSLQNAGLVVVDRDFETIRDQRPDAVIYHWPNHFFAPRSRKHTIVSLLKLGVLKLRGTKFYWVVHNLHPHDAAPIWPVSTYAFLKLLDGLIFLSASSRLEFLNTYPSRAATAHMITRHGRYPAGTSLPSPHHRDARPLQLLMFGLMREYKNVIGLIRAVTTAQHPDVTLTVVGVCFDLDLKRRIEAEAHGSDRIFLDLRSDLLDDVALDAVIDKHDAVVLPYTRILNSGVALHALGRNKPILAPAIGSLPELQQSLGQDWVSLFEPPIDADAIQRFAEQMRANGPECVDLSAYEWDVIGEEIAGFITT